MRSAQLRFWPDAQPLVERLGRDFFRQLPETAGVYLMRDVMASVLYVGKAKNLRHRLCSYRVANPERMPRRTLRLLNLVQAITWEECADEAAALSRESQLLLEIKPRFNRAGVWKGPRRFVGWRAGVAGLELAVLDSAVEGWNLAGEFWRAGGTSSSGASAIIMVPIPPRARIGRNAGRLVLRCPRHIGDDSACRGSIGGGDG